MRAKIKQHIAENGFNMVLTALAIVFIWFGVLKIIGASEMSVLVTKVLFFLPETIGLIILGSFEVLMGLALLWNKTITIGLRAMEFLLIGTFLSFILAPEIMFQNNNIFLLSMEGQFVLKNLVLIAAAIVLIHQENNKKKK